MKPKQWLYNHGHIATIGRGRLSREHIALIEQAVREGAVIEGYSVTNTKDTAVPAKVNKAAPTNVKTVVDVPDMRRDETIWQAHTMVDGVKRHVGMRTVCNNCHNSLGYCPCHTSVVWVDHERTGMVTFTVRPK